MGRIRVLPTVLVNRIAAGECVERPSSVVKELVENALDAGATSIRVEILDGGRELIQVTDDGVGMDADDLVLAVHPHATSKILTDDDLFNIHTLGFRGEALASIASVSRLTIRSRSRDTDVGSLIRVEGGRMDKPQPCPAAPGTTIEVRDLFYAVPARRKYMKTSPTEMGHITEQVARIALAQPAIAFSVVHNKRSLLDLPSAAGTLDRIRDLYGPEMADVLLPVSREGAGVRIDGFVAPPSASRPSSKWDYVFVNGRYIRDKFVSHAVKEAYRSLMDPSRYPVVFLMITIDPAHVDVNVHPTKTEVRWRDSNYIHAQVLATLREKFLATNLDHRLRGPGQADAYREGARGALVDFFTRSRDSGPPANPHGSGAFGGSRDPLHPNPGPDWVAPLKPAMPLGVAVESSATAEQLDDRMVAVPGTRRAEPGPAAVAVPTDHSLSDMKYRIERTSSFSPALSVNQAARPADSGWRSVSAPAAIQIHNTFLVVETADGMMLIDQHALHERILYEELARRIAARTLESQRLLLPEVVRVPADRLEAVETHAETLARLGIELTVSGPGSVTLHAFPLLLEKADRPAFVADLLDRLSERGARPQADTLVHDLLDMMACKAAVKAGDPLTADEITALLARRETAERSSHCPHGRPTTLHLSIRDLEKQFKRR